jgi:hypothetical protein
VNLLEPRCDRGGPLRPPVRALFRRLRPWRAAGISNAYQAGSCVAYFYNDPNIVYEIQADGSVAQTALGLDANLSNFAAGSNVTGLSQATMVATPLSTGAQGQVQILDIAPYPGNDWGDAFTIVRVQVARRQIAAVVPGI